MPKFKLGDIAVANKDIFHKKGERIEVTHAWLSYLNQNSDDFDLAETCMFDEPWIGKCKEPRLGNTNFTDSEETVKEKLCCEKHSKEKCCVCGSQAFTRCMASIGVMCGRPLCELCGAGEMCDEHASRGPLKLIKDLRETIKNLEEVFV